MAQYAKLDENNNVMAVLAVDDSKLLDSNGNEDENLGVEFLKKVTGWPLWKKTSDSIRGNFAGIGYTYSEDDDVFIAPKPFESWTLNTSTHSWDPPVAYPDDTFTDGIKDTYSWNEASGSWDKM